MPVISQPGYEADDVIGTLARKAADTGLTSIVVTSDKDMLQLVDEHTVILDPMKGQKILDAQKVVEKLGVTPEQVPDLLGLWGDSSDNIPGAPGIGEKGARNCSRPSGRSKTVWRTGRRSKGRPTRRACAIMRISSG